MPNMNPLVRELTLWLFPFYKAKQKQIKKLQLVSSMALLLNKNSPASFNWFSSIANAYKFIVYNRTKKYYEFNFDNFRVYMDKANVSEKEINELLGARGLTWAEIKKELYL